MKTKLMKFATVAVLGVFAIVALPSFASATPTPPTTSVVSKNVKDATYSSISDFADGADLGIDAETGGRNWDDPANINKAIADDETTITSGGGNGIAGGTVTP